MGRRRTNTVSWFWSMVDQSGDCWPWLGRLDRGGYGRLGFYDRNWWAHRLALHLSGTTVPAEMDVLHRCDNPRCCRPDHLFLGTAKDNARDMVAKGRQRGPKGETHHLAKLNIDDVQWIRTLQGLVRPGVMAKGFGISHAALHSIVHGKSWKGV